MELLSTCHDYRYASKFYSGLSMPNNLQVKVTDLEILC